MRTLRGISAIGLLLAGGLVAIAGCAQDTRGTWENANLPRERWRTDEAECRDGAQERAEREFALRQFEQPPSGGYSRVSSLNQFEARRRIGELFERCMTDRGYRSVARSKAD